MELRELHSREAVYIRERNGHLEGIEELNEVFSSPLKIMLMMNPNTVYCVTKALRFE